MATRGRTPRACAKRESGASAAAIATAARAPTAVSDTLRCPGRSGWLPELGSSAASVWLFAPCRSMIWGVLPPVSSGAPDR
jgi:hypothetical protein